MALTALVRYNMRERNPLAINSYPIRNGVKIYHGALVGISTIGVTDGRVVNWSDSSGALQFLGLAMLTQQVSAGSGTSGEATGDANGTVECPVMESGPILEQISVAGASAEQNVGDPVYATDEDTFTLTPTSNVGAVGRVTRYHSGTTCDVQLFSSQEYRALQEVGKV